MCGYGTDCYTGSLTVTFLDKTENTDKVALSLKNRFKDENVKCEIEKWQKKAFFYQQVKKMFNGLFHVIKIVIAIVIILGVANTMIMSVFERVQEIGTMMALGTYRSQVMLVFILEGLFIGLIGGVMGVGVGIGIAKLVALVGITIPPPPGQNDLLIIKPMILQSSIIFAFVSMIVTAFIAAIYPAYRAAMLKPIDAIQHV